MCLPEDYFTWDKCASILYNKTDEELESVLEELFEWISDIQRLGALTIHERLRHFDHNNIKFKEVYNRNLKEAKNKGDNRWCEIIKELLLSDDEFNHIHEIIEITDEMKDIIVKMIEEKMKNN